MNWALKLISMFYNVEDFLFSELTFICGRVIGANLTGNICYAEKLPWELYILQTLYLHSFTCNHGFYILFCTCTFKYWMHLMVLRAQWFQQVWLYKLFLLQLLNILFIRATSNPIDIHFGHFLPFVRKSLFYFLRNRISSLYFYSHFCRSFLEAKSLTDVSLFLAAFWVVVKMDMLCCTI